MNVVTEIIDRLTLQRRVAELGEQIRLDYEGREPILLGVLNGAVPFLADLSRRLPPQIDIDFLSLTRFGREGRVNIAVDSATPISGRDVILIEDIVDTGLTLSYLLGLLSTREPASLVTATLLDKQTRRIVDVPLEYVCDCFFSEYFQARHGEQVGDRGAGLDDVKSSVIEHEPYGGC